MVHRDRVHRARYHRDWSPIWGPRLGHCDCRRDGDTGDEVLYALVGAVIGILAGLLALAAAIIRRPALAAAVFVTGSVGLAVAALVWGW